MSIRFCEEVRALRPDIVFGADIIAGFPTETEAMFENSLGHRRGMRADAICTSSRFSPREGTPAARMPQVRREVVKERAARLRAAGGRAHAGISTRWSERGSRSWSSATALAAPKALRCRSSTRGAGRDRRGVITGHDGARLIATPLAALAA